MTNIRITNEIENPLFKRKEITATIESETTPSKADVSKALTEKSKAPEENIKIIEVTGKFGSNTFEIKANIYNSKEDLDITERKSKKQRDADKALSTTESGEEKVEQTKPTESQDTSAESQPDNKQEEKKE